MMQHQKKTLLMKNFLFFLLAAITTTVTALGKNSISPPADTQGIEYFVLFTDTQTGRSRNFRCAGALVYLDAILTTAGCADLMIQSINSAIHNGAAVQTAFARIGYATDSVNNVGVRAIEKRDIIRYPSWSPNYLGRAGDIALIFLQNPTQNVFFAAYLRQYFYNDAEQTWSILGAGSKSQYGRQNYAARLQADQITTIPARVCEAAYRNSSLPVVFSRTHHFCAGTPGVAAGACSHGDMGAPVFVNVNGFVIVGGLASFGAPGCGPDDPPFAYTRVAFYNRWIFETICKNSMNPVATCPRTSTPSSAPVLPGALSDLDVSFFSIISDTREGPGTTRCGGVLVHEDILISGAGCTKHNDIIRVGYLADFSSHAYRRPEKIVDFPLAFLDDRYTYQEYLPNDLGIIKLDEPVTDITPMGLSRQVGPGDNRVQLHFAQAGAVRDVEEPFKMGTFVEANINGVAYHSQVQTGTFRTMGFSRCMSAYKELAGYQPDLVEDVQFCTENESENTPCDANSWGTPAWYYADADESKSSPILAGIFSQGQCDGETGVPGVYTRLSYRPFQDFIKEQICELSSNPPSDCP